MSAITDEDVEPFNDLLKAILGKWLNKNNDNDEIFAEIKEICEDRLKLIGEANIYQTQNLVALLGSLGE